MQDDCSRLVSALFFKQFLKRPFRIASIVPSSKALVERVASKMDFSQPRVIARYGPGKEVAFHARLHDGCVRIRSSSVRVGPSVRAGSGTLQFAGDRRVRVIHGDAASLPHELKRHGIDSCDYILSGIPFSILKIEKKRALLQKTHDALSPGGSFIIYQVTNELKQHAIHFERAESEYFLQNIPPMFITVFQKAPPLDHHERKPLPGTSFSVSAHRSA